MSRATIRRTVYDEPTEAELRRWPGVTFTREVRGKHYALVLRFSGQQQRVVYPCTPGDSLRGPLNHLSDVRATLRKMGAERLPEPKSTAPVRRRNPPSKTATITPPVLDRDPSRDPWQVLAALKIAGPPPAQPEQPPVVPPRLPWWRRVLRSLSR